MEVLSNYSVCFPSDSITQQKYNMLIEKAFLIRDLKNEISKIISKNLYKYSNYSRIGFQKEFNPLINSRIGSNHTKQICDDVLSCYKNKFQQIMRKVSFSKYETKKIVHVKKTKKFKKGEVELITTKRFSPICETLTYLSRYGKDDTLEYILNVLPIIKDEKKRIYYEMILRTCERMGFDRLLALALDKRNRIVEKYSNPVEFMSLTFRGRSRLVRDILSTNRNKNSKIKAFIEISWDEGNTIILPVKYSSKYQGNTEEYTNGRDTSYTVVFNEIKKQITVVLTKEKERYYPEVDLNPDEIVGFDVNTKNNMIVGSNGFEADYNRKTVNKLVKELQKIDKLKETNKEYKPGKKRQNRIAAQERSIKGCRVQNVSDACKDMVNKGQSHAVLENIDNSFGRTKAKTVEGFNQNRLTNILHLAQIKHDFDHIGRKYGIAVSFVHPYFTSQECRKCGYINPGNRMTQETFKCLDCGHEENADSNASYTIGSRVSEAVLRNLLDASQTVNGAFRPQNLTIKQVRTTLDTLRDTRFQRDRTFTDPTSEILTDSS